MLDKFSFRFYPFRAVLAILSSFGDESGRAGSTDGRGGQKGDFQLPAHGPSNCAQIIRKLRQGTEFEVAGKSSHYFNLRLADGVTGWLHYF